MAEPERDRATRRHTMILMLDGIGDHATARRLTRDLSDEGLASRADPAGMWLEVESNEPIDEAFSDRVSEIARRSGMEPRDRVGSSFVPGIGIDALRRRLAHEWTSRFATGLVFLLPALALHYLHPHLAGATNYVPNLIEAVLVGWAIIAAAWPVVYQALLSLAALRLSPDLFQGSLILVSFLIGVGQTLADQSATMFDITIYAVLLIALQRMVVWRNVWKLEGRAHLMLPLNRVLGVILAGALATLFFDARGAGSMMLATPAMMGLLAVNRLAHPFVWVAPIVLFAAFIAWSPLVLPAELLTARTESAAAFCALLTILCGRFADAPASDASDSRNASDSSDASDESDASEKK